MKLFFELTLLISVFLIIYHHGLYPLLLKWVLKFKNTNVSRPVIADEDLPSIEVIIPAFNEGDFIADKLRNLAILDYPADKLSVLVICDGCTDDTAAIARATLDEMALSGLDLTILESAVNLGKLSIINDWVPAAKADLVALSDVSALISIDALRIAAQRFLDPTVGAVNGNYRLLNSGGPGEAAYWKYQGSIMKGEEAFGSVLGAHGAFYIFRKELFAPLPVDTINDDFVLPMMLISKGFHVVYDESINAVEMERSDEGMTWNRRVRIGMGNLQQALLLSFMFSPKFGGVSFTFMSSKGLRVLMPFLMIYCFFLSLCLSPESLLYLLIFGGQALAYCICLMVVICGQAHCDRYSQMLYYLVSGHSAALVGCFRYVLASKRQWS